MSKIWIYRDPYPGDGDSILIGDIETELQQMYTRVVEYSEYQKIEDENKQLKMVIEEFSKSAEAMETLCSGLKLAAKVFGGK